MLLSLPKIRRMVRSALRLPDNTTHAYWEQVAKQDPYSAICTGWDATKFESDLERDNALIAPELLEKNKVALDLACGIGRIAKFVAPNIKQYVGVDFSAGMIEKAKKRYKAYPNVMFVHNDGKMLDALRDNTFDLAFCFLAFQHMSKLNTQLYIDEVYRVLKSGGVFISQVPRLDYYKDDKFAFTEDENNTLFKKYSHVSYRNKGPAYFLMQVTK